MSMKTASDTSRRNFLKTTVVATYGELAEAASKLEPPKTPS
jgi:hypothetical protein